MKGRLTREKLHDLSVAAATERLRLEDALEMVEARLSEPAGAGQQPPGPSRLLQGWTDLGFGEKQRALRDAVARVTVTDGQVDVALRY
jgi:hypothetical protein